MGMVNFNWNNYIGEHMDEPLEVSNIKGNVEYLFAVTAWNIQLDNTPEFTGVTFDHDFENCKPLIKSPADLMADDWLFVVFGDNFKIDCRVSRYGTYIDVMNENDIIHLRFNKLKPNSMQLNQNQWNRLYSLHVSLDYDELIKNNKAVRKG